MYYRAFFFSPHVISREIVQALVTKTESPHIADYLAVVWMQHLLKEH